MNQIFLYILLLLVVVLLGVLIAMLVSFKNTNFNIQKQLFTQNRQSLEAQQESQSALSASMQSILTSLTSLSRSQAYDSRSLNWMQEQVEALSRVMVNTKSRGNWGEYQLETLLSAYAGSNPAIFERQFRLDNGRIADAAFHIPGSSQVLCIDSKFPMENYNRLCQDPDNAAFYEKNLRQNLKKHIDDIADKYITSQTADQAVLFLPSDAIYEYVCSSLDGLLEYALQRHVLMTSPTTLIGIVFTLLASSRDFYRSSSLQDIEKRLYSLQEDLQRLETRLEKAGKSLEAAGNTFALARVSACQVKNKYEKLLEGSGKETYDLSDEG